MINSFKNPAIMRILRTTERHGAGWREQNFIPDHEAVRQVKNLSKNHPPGWFFAPLLAKPHDLRYTGRISSPRSAYSSTERGRRKLYVYHS